MRGQQQQCSDAVAARAGTPARLAQSVPRPHSTLAGRATAAVAAAAQEPHQAAAVLVQDGCRVTAAPSSAQALLSQHGGGSYTTALVRGGHSVVDWQLHIQRLVRNMQVLSQQRPPAYAAFTAWQQQQTSSPGGASSETAAAVAVEQLILPSVTAALQQLAATTTCEDASLAAEQQQAMLAILLTDPLPSAAAPGRSRPLLSVLVWAKPLLPAPAAAPSPAKVLVAGDPRPTAHAKHCEWVAARQPLEALRQRAGADEVVLLDSRSGALLEGLVTNFFVLADAAAAAVQLAGGSSDAAAAAGAGSGPCAGLVLLTTGPQHSALQGVMQQRVVQACRGLGLSVLLQPARLGQQAAWRGAFLTNCVRGVQVVSQLQLPGSEVWQPPDSQRAEAAVAAIRRAVVQVQRPLDVRRGS